MQIFWEKIGKTTKFFAKQAKNYEKLLNFLAKIRKITLQSFFFCQKYGKFQSFFLQKIQKNTKIFLPNIQKNQLILC